MSEKSGTGSKWFRVSAFLGITSVTGGTDTISCSMRCGIVVIVL